ncbi:type 1 glutamine amidotransferase domain-containing protein [Pseudomarimonas arenosa]|uniref:DJ-1/PfpI family protein n=1 Tax=Pseudomarimonas arenosa TaxID=2774145 RepID=A0AAW3ZN93_9GAMM|nr:type 1 glutamine amidotransferase domain-containing protein [Pseudomarimonas arenosa]MBD8526390.1 DJ-1/PfpI family protein [Pseudomarimonas arenosa]
MKRTQQTVLVALPARDYDPSEAALPWQRLREAGIAVRFATPLGEPSEPDQLMLSGQGLDLWGWIPGLRRMPLLGLMLRANREARRAHADMVGDSAYRHPVPYAELRVEHYDGLLLPGGHRARGMRAYLEDPLLQGLVADCFERDLPVAAICHGVVLAARSRRESDGRSVLHGRKTTGLTWNLERSAWNLMRFAGRIWDPNYYRTYPERRGEPAGYRSVQAEVSRALASPDDFLDVPAGVSHRWRKRSGLFRDGPQDHRAAWVVCDGNYVSARWPGDVHAFSQKFVEVMGGSRSMGSAA